MDVADDTQASPFWDRLERLHKLSRSLPGYMELEKDLKNLEQKDPSTIYRVKIILSRLHLGVYVGCKGSLDGDQLKDDLALAGHRFSSLLHRCSLGLYHHCLPEK